MDKYKILFFKKLKQTIEEWTELSIVPNHEVYRLLHSLKGTAASIGLEQFSEIATTKLDAIEEQGDKQWKLEEWNMVLHEMMSMLPETISEENLDKPSAIPIPAHTQQPEERSVANFSAENELVLIVDNDLHLLSMKQCLENEGLNIQVAVDGEQALRVFYDLKPDCIVLDIDLPGQSGFEVLAGMIEKAQSAFIPIVLISGDDLRETRMKAYQLGAVDFMSKPLDMQEFLIRILNRLKQKKAIQNSILVDELTGAFNRKFLQVEMVRQFNDSARSGQPFSIAMADIDYFKKINDQYGHDVGDVVLRTFSQTMIRHKRTSDSFIRYGGEEFMLLFPNTKQKEAADITRRLLKQFSSIIFPHPSGDFSGTCSAGIAEMGTDTLTSEELIKQADEALYMAKQLGRNRVEIFDAERTSALQSQKVLHIGIVDDDPVIHQMLTDHLTRMTIPNVKVKVQEFREGESFLNSEWAQQPGKFLILLDGMMPRMDGLEILYQLRKDRSKQDFTVVMLTGRKNEKDIVRALELGADDYMTKPFSIVELEARVKRWAMRMLGEKARA